MISALVLALALAQAPAQALPGAAAAHNDRALALYEEGRLDEALAELTAAYAAMPDPRADRAGRDSVLGSIRGVLLELHARTAAPAPLCDLRTRLRDHLAALADPPEDPRPADLVAIEAHLRDVEARLAALPSDTCGAATAAPRPAPPPAPPPARPAERPDEIPPKHLRIAGGVLIGLGGALAGVMTYGLVDQSRLQRRAREVDEAAAGRPLTPDEFADLKDLRADAVMRRNLAIGAGAAAGVAVVFGAVLVARGRPARASRLAVAPLWLARGAGLGLTLRLR